MLDQTGTKAKGKAKNARNSWNWQRTARNAIKAIRVIGKLGNKNAYESDDST